MPSVICTRADPPAGGFGWDISGWLVGKRPAEEKPNGG